MYFFRKGGWSHGRKAQPQTRGPHQKQPPHRAAGTDRIPAAGSRAGQGKTAPAKPACVAAHYSGHTTYGTGALRFCHLSPCHSPADGEKRPDAHALQRDQLSRPGGDLRTRGNGTGNTPEPTPEVIDNRTEWQKKFAEHFTEEVVITENSYTSPNIAITMSTITIDDPSPTVCYVADIYIAQIENFQTYWANGQLSYYGEENSLSMAINSGAILSINGDYADNQRSGFLVRNGEIYYDDQTTYDICVLYYDGSMETFSPSEYAVDDILAKAPYQVWKFGPELLDENGQPKQSYNTSDAISWENPRSGIGYYEPGHYCFITVDGRQNGYSRGLEIERFAKLFADLGCTVAYNLDGGQSAVMTFDQRVYNQPYLGGRNSGDILLIRELPESTEGGEGE